MEQGNSAQKQKWRVEKSAGGIVYKKDDGKIFVLLIMPMGRNFGPPEGYWTFPKGLIDEGEEDSLTAIREVKEETGDTGKIIEDLKSVKFFRGYDQTLKFVHYYLMEYDSGEPKDHDKEIAKVEWVPIDEVEKKLKFPHDKEIFEKAKNVINSNK